MYPLGNMPATRSSTRSATGSNGNVIPAQTRSIADIKQHTEKGKTNTRKRQADHDLQGHSKPKRLTVRNKPTHDEAEIATPSATVSHSTTSIVAENDLVPAVLTFDFEEAKKHLLQADSRFGDLFSKLKCKPFQHLEQVHPFRSLVTSILGQQVSWQAARSITHKFRRLFDPSLPERPIDEEDNANSSFPTPQQVIAAEGAALRTAGLSLRKVEYVQDLAARFADGRLSTSKLLKATDEELAEMLIEVRGIGRWTVDMFAIFSLRRPDILPVGMAFVSYAISPALVRVAETRSTGDLGVQRGVLRWFLSRYSDKHSYSISPEKVAGGTDTAKSRNNRDNDQLPSLVGTPEQINGPHPPISTATSGMIYLPPTFTPSIKKVLEKPSVAPGMEPPSLPDGIDIALLKTRLDGKKKVKGAFLTPQEMSALTEGWKPYRSLGVYYMWSLSE